MTKKKEKTKDKTQSGISLAVDHGILLGRSDF